jgi:cell division control protein 6
MLGIVNAIVVNRGRYGVTKEITLDTPQDNVYHVLSDDLRLQSLMDLRPDSIQMQLG